MHKHRRGLSPSTLIATAALIAATGGTAIAQSEILISDPDQVAPNVLRGRHIENEDLTNSDLRDPQLKLRVRADATKNGSGDGTVKRAPGAQKGVYDVTFNDFSLGSDGEQSDSVVSENCAITATARSAAAPPASSLDAIATVFVMRTVGPYTVRVSTIDPTRDDRLIDTAFDITASC